MKLEAQNVLIFSARLLFRILWRENRHHFTPAVLTTLSKEGLSAHNIIRYTWQVPNPHHILFWEHKQEIWKNTIRNH